MLSRLTTTTNPRPETQRPTSKLRCETLGAALGEPLGTSTALGEALLFPALGDELGPALGDTPRHDILRARNPQN
jgi:hypothetical protein